MIAFLVGLALLLVPGASAGGEAAWQIGVAVTTGSRGEILPCT